MITVTYNPAPGGPVPYHSVPGGSLPYHPAPFGPPVPYHPTLGSPPFLHYSGPGGSSLTTQGGQNANPQPVSRDLPVDEYIKAQRAADLDLAWDKTPPEVEMLQIRQESLMERQIGSEPLIPTRGIDLSLFTRPQKDQTSSSPSEPSMLQRLPDELLLMIVSGISDPNDKSSLFAFFALRQVSRRFRRLLQAEDFIHYPFSRQGCCQMCADGYNDKYTSPICPPGGRHCFDYKSGGEVHRFQGALKIKGVWGVGGLGDFIRSYTTCKNCQESREDRIKAGYSTNCKFGPCHSEELLHCHSCERDHPPSCFSPDQAKLPNGRVCIAHEGYIRICDHKTLTRADIKLLLPSEVPEGHPVFVTSCDHPEHKVSCNDSFDYTDQTPRVFATKSDSLVMLHILWQGHSGSDRTVLHQSGYLHRHKLNNSLRKIRQNGGHLFLPQRGPNTLPEWSVISEIDRSEVVSSDEDLIKLRGGWGHMNRQRRHNLALLGSDRIACGHCRYDKRCIVVNYHRKICFMDAEVGWASHEWFHAMDRKSYVYNGPAGVPETCNIEGCRNSYVGKEDQVDQWLQTVNWICERDDYSIWDSTCKLLAQEKQRCRDDRRTFQSWEVYEPEELGEALSPREQLARQDHRTEELEEAPAPREQPAYFSWYSLTTSIRQYWQTGRANFSTD